LLVIVEFSVQLFVGLRFLVLLWPIVTPDQFFFLCISGNVEDSLVLQ